MRSGDVSSDSHIFSADADYIKLLIIYNHDFYYSLKAGGQYSPAALTLQDRLAIGSRWRVRGFKNSLQLIGNSGFYTQSNVGFMTSIVNSEWYFGVNYGQLWNNNYAESQYNSAKLMSATTGMKGKVASVMYNFFVSTRLIYPDVLPVDSMNLNFEVSYQF